MHLFDEMLGAAASSGTSYAQLANIARARLAGWTIAFLSADRLLEAQVKLPLDKALQFRNGGIPVRLVRTPVEDASA